MHYKSLILSFFFFYYLSAPVEAMNDARLERMVTGAGVVLTPNKSALKRVADGGRPVIHVILSEQANAEKIRQQQEVEKREKLAQQKEQAKEEQRQREKAELLEKMRREEEEKLAKERAERYRLLEVLRLEQEEKLDKKELEGSVR